MLRYAYKPKTENSVLVYGSGLRVSNKNSIEICKAITGKSLQKGKKLLQGMLENRLSLDGKYYTNTAKEILKLLELSEHNAEFKGLEPEKMIIHASAHKGFTYYRPRRFKMKRQQRKIANIQIVLEQR